jgi:hypothetical protein
MQNELPEPEKRPLDSLLIPWQREAVERFLNGSERETFKYEDATVIIEQDKHSESYWLVWRMPVVKILDWTEEIVSASVQDIRTHIAQNVGDALKWSGRKWYGAIVRDTVEAIVGIPPFETARLQYLILFLIKRGYVPVGQLAGRTMMTQALLYANNLPYDLHLSEEQIEDVIKILQTIYKDSKEVSSWRDIERKENAELQLRKRNFRYHIRLQYSPELAKKVYNIIQGDTTNYYEKIDEVVGEIIKIAYKK